MKWRNEGDQERTRCVTGASSILNDEMIAPRKKWANALKNTNAVCLN
jgi:hypothetical protein